MTLPDWTIALVIFLCSAQAFIIGLLVRKLNQFKAMYAPDSTAEAKQ